MNNKDSNLLTKVKEWLFNLFKENPRLKQLMEDRSKSKAIEEKNLKIKNQLIYEEIFVTGSRKKIKSFLKKFNFYPNELYDYGRTPLYEAIFKGNNPEVIKVLIEHGADPNKADVQNSDHKPRDIITLLKYSEKVDWIPLVQKWLNIEPSLNSENTRILPNTQNNNSAITALSSNLSIFSRNKCHHKNSKYV